jgi:hypothetical protein
LSAKGVEKRPSKRNTDQQSKRNACAFTPTFHMDMINCVLYSFIRY